jgi:hypothetical protein
MTKSVSGTDHVTYADMEEELARLRAALALLANCVGAHIISQDNARRLELLLRPSYQRDPEERR